MTPDRTNANTVHCARAVLLLVAALAVAPAPAAPRGAGIPEAYHGTWAYGSPAACDAHAAGQDSADLMYIASDTIGFWEGSYDIVAVRHTRRGLQLDVREHGPGMADTGVPTTVQLDPTGPDRIGMKTGDGAAYTVYRCRGPAETSARTPAATPAKT